MPVSERRWVWVRTGLAAGSVVSALVCFGALVAGASFFGQTDEQAFDQWRHRPLALTAAIAFVGLAAAACWARSPERSRRRERMVLAVTGLMVLTVGAGLVDVHLRTHPQGYEERALLRLAVPAGEATDLTSSGSTPQEGQLSAGPLGSNPPVGVRSWGPTDCAVLRDALVGWADSGSVWVPAPDAGPPDCYLAATFHGWPVRAEIVGTPSDGIARVTLSTPYG